MYIFVCVCLQDCLPLGSLNIHIRIAQYGVSNKQSNIVPSIRIPRLEKVIILWTCSAKSKTWRFEWVMMHPKLSSKFVVCVFWFLNMFNGETNSDWFVVSTPLKDMKVSWDDYSQYMETYNMFQTTNQVIMLICRSSAMVWEVSSQTNPMCSLGAVDDRCILSTPSKNGTLR